MKSDSKNKLILLINTIVCVIIFLSSCNTKQNSWIRHNQLGYLPVSIKKAVYISHTNDKIRKFCLRDPKTDEIVWKSDNVEKYDGNTVFGSVYYLDFTEMRDTGTFYLETGSCESGSFRISPDIYLHTADFLLKYMRQQRCGFNPFYDDSCHVHDGFIVFNPDPGKDSIYIDVTGGWHDASDYLQYVTTSANAVFQMLFAFEQNPTVFVDQFDKNGKMGPNGIPDIIDEAKWGLDWLIKMYPEKDMMFKQIADDRDHAGFRLPTNDSVNYGRAFQRPVYFSTGKPQGYGKNMNRTTGMASLAGKFASAFALGSKLLDIFYPDFAGELKKKATDAFQLGKENPGYCQTNPCGAPYFYEEENWVDDMALAAIQLYLMTKEYKYLKSAVEFGRLEPVTPWMGNDTARHYQWYPFLNLGHYYIAINAESDDKNVFTGYLKQGIDRVAQKSLVNPFGIGVPFIWCSNNLVAAMLSQCLLYGELTGDETYLQMEASLRDWLFGCNPWGTSMIVGLPGSGDYPEDTHSALSYLLKKQPLGGLVDGPVYPNIFNNLKGIYLSAPDEYLEVQPGFALYHDDFADYSTNEPTMDGTASLTYCLSALEKEGVRQKKLLKEKN